MEKIYDIEIVTAQEWGAKPGKGNPHKTTSDKIIIHHMATPNPPNNYSRDDAGEIARRCQDWHFANGWIDTGQHFTISTDGTILEGRQGSIAALKEGSCISSAHCINYNNNWGIEIEGSHQKENITNEQEKSLIDLCAIICKKCSIQSRDLFGHCNFDPGKPHCPGKTVMDRLPELKRMVHDRVVELQG